jgi:hypothetical protein
MAVSFKKKIRSNTKSIIAKNGSAFFVHKNIPMFTKNTAQ